MRRLRQLTISAVLLLLGSVFLFETGCFHKIVGAMDKSDIAVQINLPKQVDESGDAILIEARIINQTDSVIVIKQFDQTLFSSEEAFRETLHLINASAASAESWGNVLQPYGSKVVYFSRTFQPGEQPLSVTVKYGIPSPAFIKTNLFEVVGERSQASGNYPIQIYPMFHEDHPVLVIKNPEADAKAVWKTFEHTSKYKVNSDPLVDTVREKIKVAAFRKNIPYFGYVFASNNVTYLFLNKHLEPIGSVGFDALECIGSKLGSSGEGRVLILSNYQNKVLGDQFSPKEVKQPEFELRQKVSLINRHRVWYGFEVSQKELPKLWTSLREDKSGLFCDEPELFIIDRF